MTISTRSHLSLKIISESGSIEEITTFLGISPDKAWNTGEAIVTPNGMDTGKKYAFTAWFLDSQCIEAERDLNKHIDSLFKRINSVKTKIRTLSKAKISLNFNIYIYDKNEAPNIYITPDSIEKINSIGASISVEVWK